VFNESKFTLKVLCEACHEILSFFGSTQVHIDHFPKTVFSLKMTLTLEILSIAIELSLEMHDPMNLHCLMQ
jgi:hypothetical protein